jgi:1-acyl-sn-glycerol-3-phosphate acyltransferase
MWLEPAVRLVATAAARIYYRLEIAGPPVPTSGPVLLVANHPNGLLDPALVIAAARRRVRFLAKSTLFSDLRLGWLVRGAGAIPVYRRVDDASQSARNEGAFEAVFEALGGGDAVGIFPEGISHSNPSLSALKTGAARMALGSCERARRIVPIVPIGLVFRRKDAFRSEALALLGEPVPWSDLAECGAEDREAVRELTERIDRDLRRLTVNLDSWEDAPLVEWTEAIWAAERETYDDPAEQLARTNEIATVLAALRRQRETSPAEGPPAVATELAAEISMHRRRMLDLALEPRDLAGSQSARRARRPYRMLDPISALVAGAGFALFWLPYELTGRLAALARPPAETRSTYRVLVGVAVYAVWLAGLSGLAGWLGGAWVALATLVGVPVVGLLGLRIRERRRDQRRVWRKVSRVLPRKDLVTSLRTAQSEIADRLDDLYQSWRRGEITAGPSPPGASDRSDSE